MGFIDIVDMMLLVIPSDVDECQEKALPCPGLDELCTNVEGSFLCICADGFIDENNVCVKKQRPSEYLT